MKLVIGGCFQGKLEYVLKSHVTNYSVFEAELPGEEQVQEATDMGKTMIVNGFHKYMKNGLWQGGNPEQEISDFVSKVSDCIIISDEIGNGIVPTDRFEREYRERTGRILVELARQADEVMRVVCGIGQKIK